MNFIRRLWRSTFGKIVLILSGGIGLLTFCCVAAVVMALVVGPTERRTQPTAVAQRFDNGRVETNAVPTDAATVIPTEPATSTPTAIEPTSTQPPATATPILVARIGDVVQDATWKITITDIRRADSLPHNTPNGQWVIVSGTAENISSAEKALSTRDFVLTAPGLAQPIEIDRTATWAAADREPQTFQQTVARLGGMFLKPGTSAPLIMVFDVPAGITELTLRLPRIGQEVALGTMNHIAGLPTPTPLPLPTSIPPTITPTPRPSVQVAKTVNLRSGPSTAFPVLRTLQANATTELLAMREEHGERWYQVRSGGETGWVSGTVLEIDPALAARLPVNTERFDPPTPEPKPKPAPQRTNCDPAYPGVCNPSYPPDLDCGDIPYQDFSVPGADPHRFDRDNDGIGCES